MGVMGLQAIYKGPNTSKKHPEHRIYPYLLRKLPITRTNQVWCSDITYIPVKNGFLYLVAIMDWATRKVLTWRLSNTLDASFCVEALEEAISKYGKPEIMNTDQGSQYTGSGWITTSTEAKIKISMDGRGRYLDNIFIERLWRSLKQEAAYLHEPPPSRQIALQSPAGQQTVSKRNGLSMTGLDFTILSALTPPLISGHRTSHTSPTRRYEKWHKQKPGTS
jgi:transposase InsO family protein